MRAASSRCSLDAGWGIRVHNCGARHRRDPPTCRTTSTPARSSHADSAEESGVLRTDSFIAAIYRRRKPDALMAHYANALFLQRQIILAYRVRIIRESRRDRFGPFSPTYQTTNGPEASMRPGPSSVGLCEDRTDTRVDSTGRSRMSPLFAGAPSGRTLLCGALLCGALLCGARLCGARLCGARLCGARLCRAISGTEGPSVDAGSPRCVRRSWTG